MIPLLRPVRPCGSIPQGASSGWELGVGVLKWSNLLFGLSFMGLTAWTVASADQVVDIHVHYDARNANFFSELQKLSERINYSACVLTRYEDRQIVADAARKYPGRVIPFGYVELDGPDALRQVRDFHALGYRGLGELEFVKKPFNDPSYQPVYAQANEYHWLVLFHTGTVVREKFDQPEDVASYRMRAFYLEEVARRYPQLTVVGGHCGNPEYEWAAEVARWNPNVFFDLSGSTLVKFRGRLSDFMRFFWWSGTDWGTDTPDSDPSAFSKLVFGSDAGWDASSLQGVEGALNDYRAFFDANHVPAQTRRRILGGTLAKMLLLPQ